jgi:hypothetical protein
MRRASLFISLFLMLSGPVFSQAFEGTVEYNKKKHAAYIIEYAYPPEAVENALIEKMEQLGYKSKEEKGMFNKDKGFRVHKGAYINDIHESSMDYAFKVERKSRRDKDESVVYLVILRNGQDAKSIFLNTDIEKAKSFLNNLQPRVESSHLELQIKGQEDGVSKAEKKLKTLQEDQTAMEKKIKQLQEDLETNAKDQEKQKKEVDSQKSILDVLKGKRKP